MAMKEFHLYCHQANNPNKFALPLLQGLLQGSSFFG